MSEKKSDIATNDRRQFSRVDFRHEISITDSKGRVYKGAFNDVSLKGMLFCSDNLPPAGEKITGAMALGDESMAITGSVLRASQKDGVAIRFENMDVESFSHLRRLVSLNMGDAEHIDEEFFNSL